MWQEFRLRIFWMHPPAGCNFINGIFFAPDDFKIWKGAHRVEMEDIYQLFNLLPMRKEGQ